MLDGRGRSAFTLSQRRRLYFFFFLLILSEWAKKTTGDLATKAVIVHRGRGNNSQGAGVTSMVVGRQRSDK